MFRVLGCIFEQHDLRLVLLAALLCLLASATAMSMISRARAAAGQMRLIWLVTGGAVAGCGIWGLHFVAMLAYGAGLPVDYDPALTLLSAFIAMSLCAAGFALALGRRNALAGGIVTGIAISAMHYTGMAAVRIPAVPHWDMSYVAASVLIGIVVTAAALYWAVRRNDLPGYSTGAGLFVVAIVGMHFTAMAAVVYVPNPLIPMPDALMAPSMLAVAVAAAVALIMGCGLIGALVDRHLASRASQQAEHLRAHITALEATQAELRRTSADLSAALEAAGAANLSKSRFLAAMSHELRTPLNAVIGFSEMLAMEVFGPLGSPRYKEYASDIRGSGVHLLALINDILDLSRIDAGEAQLEEEELDLRLIVSQSMRMVAHQAEMGGVALDSQFEAAPPRLFGDRRRVKQVLINLLGNAVKFTPQGGRITIRVFPAGEGIAVAVRDTGIGIAAKDIPKAMERFGQVDSALSRKYDGVGLGLPLARSLMELHDGSLRLESVPGEGTVVTVTFPAARLRQAVSTEEAA
jgi:signal transduction histidine kinase